jgi:hypothetical protein
LLVYFLVLKLVKVISYNKYAEKISQNELLSPHYLFSDETSKKMTPVTWLHELYTLRMDIQIEASVLSFQALVGLREGLISKLGWEYNIERGLSRSQSLPAIRATTGRVDTALKAKRVSIPRVITTPAVDKPRAARSKAKAAKPSTTQVINDDVDDEYIVYVEPPPKASARLPTPDPVKRDDLEATVLALQNQIASMKKAQAPPPPPPSTASVDNDPSSPKPSKEKAIKRSKGVAKKDSSECQSSDTSFEYLKPRRKIEEEPYYSREANMLEYLEENIERRAQSKLINNLRKENHELMIQNEHFKALDSTRDLEVENAQLRLMRDVVRFSKKGGR